MKIFILFENIGKKIKALAKWSFVVVAVVSILVGIIGTVVALDGDEYLVAIFLPITFAGPILALLSAWMLYGFGELIDKATEISRNTAGNAAGAGGEVKSEVQRAKDSKRIARLEELRKKELITEEEYRAALAKEQ